MDWITYKQFSAQFPICNNCVSSDRAWAELLKRWRDEERLVEKKHWHYGPSVDEGFPMSRYFDPVRVIKLVVLEHQKGNPRPRIAFLCQTYTEALAEILNAAAAPTDEKQAVPS